MQMVQLLRGEVERPKDFDLKDTENRTARLQFNFGNLLKELGQHAEAYKTLGRYVIVNNNGAKIWL